MAKIILIRHGHVEGIAPERFRGRRDIDLSELGRRQAQAMAQRVLQLWQPAVVYSSPLKRCLQTLEPIAARLGLPVKISAELNDLHYGDWEWLTYEEARSRSPALFARWFTAPQLVKFPNGESLQDLLARVAEVVRLIRDRHERHTVVVVGHASVNRALLLQMLDQPASAYWRFAQDPCGVSEIELTAENATLHRLNETPPPSAD
jgi:phosphoserine phosphatase